MSFLGVAHVVLALGALAAGLVVAMLRKGTAAHRQAGWLYVAAMIGVNVTALLIYRLLGRFGPFHVAAIFSLLTVVAGLVPVRRRVNRWWLPRHAYWMSGSYVGLWAAAVAETVTRLDLLPFWWMVAIATGLVMLAGAALIGRFVPGAIAGLKRRPAQATTASR